MPGAVPQHRRDEAGAAGGNAADATAAPVAPYFGISRRSSTTVTATPTPMAIEFSPGRPAPYRYAVARPAATSPTSPPSRMYARDDGRGGEVAAGLATAHLLFAPGARD